MAEIWGTAFGRYLRALRERRSLSLHDVSSLSQGFAETLNKGYLSRCENGRQRLAFSKLIPLSRIYGVDSDVLLERLELDLELDRVGSPETDGMTFVELTQAGKSALNAGYKWNAYGYLRDAVGRARVDPVSPNFRDAEDQFACSVMSCGTAARSLCRYKFALHEFLWVLDDDSIGPRFHSILLERLSITYRTLGNKELAIKFADAAINQAQRDDFLDCRGYAFSNRAVQAFEDKDLETAATYFEKAYETFRSIAQTQDCARALNNLAQVYFDLNRTRAARRALVAADNTMREVDQPLARAHGRILMGEIDAAENNGKLAEKRWKEAAAIAKSLNDKVLRFKAEYQLYIAACRREDHAVARSIRRRLLRLSNWIPSTTPELNEFERMESAKNEAG